jgi:hypothetical protein
VPTTSSLGITRGPVIGGSSVTVTGAGFLDATELSCRFGSRDVTATFSSATKLVCRAPSQSAAGTVSVFVTNNGVDFSTGLSFIYDRMLVCSCSLL